MRIGSKPTLSGKRVLITGGARGIGAALARRLHERGARVAVVGLEPEKLEEVARSCVDAPWAICDVANRAQVDSVINRIAEKLGGLDVVVANAGIATQTPLIGDRPELMDQTIKVNLLGVYNTFRAAGPHISHSNGYALIMSSLAAAVQLPMMGAYSASKAGVEALGNTLRIELRPSGARVGVAYFAQLDTDMTLRGFGTKAARALPATKRFVRIAPLEVGIDALERGIARRARRVIAPRWMAPALPFRMIVQAVADRVTRPRLARVLEIARAEKASLTTTQPEEPDE